MQEQTIWEVLQNMQAPERPPSAYAQAKADVEAFNENPRAYSDRQKLDIVARAKQLGLDYSQGSAGDVSTAKEKAIAFGGGALDSLLFGILKDKWYSDTRTEKYANAGKLAGTAASFFIPAAGTVGVAGRLLGGAGKGSKAMLGVAKALTSVGRVDKVRKGRKMIETTMTLKDALAAAQLARKAATPAEYIKAALRLQLAARAAGNAGFEDAEKPYENPTALQRYLETLPGYNQQALGN